MEIRLQISDGAYQRMMAHGGRVQGTIGLVNPQEGNFNEHMRRAATASTEYIRLAHGRASVDEKKRDSRSPSTLTRQTSCPPK